MTQPIIIWSIIVGILLLIFLVRIIQCLSAKFPRQISSHHHILEMSRERDMFIGPWEPVDEEDDFEDL